MSCLYIDNSLLYKFGDMLYSTEKRTTPLLSPFYQQDRMILFCIKSTERIVFAKEKNEMIFSSIRITEKLLLLRDDIENTSLQRDQIDSIFSIGRALFSREKIQEQAFLLTLLLFREYRETHSLYIQNGQDLSLLYNETRVISSLQNEQRQCLPFGEDRGNRFRQKDENKFSSIRNIDGVLLIYRGNNNTSSFISL